ncbi:unnamed protein product [Dibothriocephalus latus]|uniref:Uncharacterized protein n=1 Tax=Dibothriocephalus latus TaxID=60516 RepID=A0A3P7MSK2_DIBLA|nr:unnamed protein product [Dibothriocephalus latus]
MYSALKVDCRMLKIRTYFLRSPFATILCISLESVSVVNELCHSIMPLNNPLDEYTVRARIRATLRLLEEVADGEPATPTSLARTPVASDFTFKKPKDVTPEPEETPAHQTTSPKPDSELPPPKPTPSVAEPQEKKSGQSSFAASSPASSIVVLNSDDAEEVDEGGQYHPQLPSTESALANQSDQPADGGFPLFYDCLNH